MTNLVPYTEKTSFVRLNFIREIRCLCGDGDRSDGEVIPIQLAIVPNTEGRNVPLQKIDVSCNLFKLV
jgi:hypothetical protein